MEVVVKIVVVSAISFLIISINKGRNKNIFRYIIIFFILQIWFKIL